MTLRAIPKHIRIAIRADPYTGEMPTGHLPHPSQITGEWKRVGQRGTINRPGYRELPPGSDYEEIYEVMNWTGDHFCGFPHDQPTPAVWKLEDRVDSGGVVSETSYFACDPHKRELLKEPAIMNPPRDPVVSEPPLGVSPAQEAAPAAVPAESGPGHRKHRASGKRAGSRPYVPVGPDDHAEEKGA